MCGQLNARYNSPITANTKMQTDWYWRMELQIANSHINCNYCASTSVGVVRTHATLSHDLHSLKGSTKPIHQNATLSQQLHASVAISATPRGNANVTLLGKSSSCGLHNPARYHIRKNSSHYIVKHCYKGISKTTGLPSQLSSCSRSSAAGHIS